MGLRTKKDSPKRSWAHSAALSYLTVLGLAVQLSARDAGQSWLLSLLSAMGGFSVSQILLLAGLCCLYHSAAGYVASARWSGRDKACVLIPAGLFAAFMVVGYSFEARGTLELVLGGFSQMVKCLVMWNGYLIAFSISIAALYTWLSSIRLWQKSKTLKAGKDPWGRYLHALTAHPFQTAFWTLFLCYLPYMVLSYPGIFMGDTGDMVAQGFNVPYATSALVNLIDESITLNGHHPVAYTMLLHWGMVTGKALFGSYNVGVFFVALFQALVQFATMSAVIAQLIRLKLRPGIAVGLLAYFVLAPRIQNYTFLLTKDVLSTASLLLFLLFLFRILAEEGRERANMLGYCLSGLALCLFRNEWKYIILAALVVTWILAPMKRRQLVMPGLVALLAAALFFHGLMPALRIAPGGTQEMLSVPFQQTARYVRDHGAQVTPDERAAISAVLDYGTLAERYQPELSDRVKATYHKSATGQELAAYFKAWLQMGLKRPGTYVQATINNYYYYVYPGPRLANLYSYSWSEHCMELANEKLEAADISLGLQSPEGLSTWRQEYEDLRERAFELPLLSVLRSPAAYVWGLMLMVFYDIRRRGRLAFALILPLLLVLGTCLLGPTNGVYFRYLHGISVALPVVFFLREHLEKKGVA